MDWPAIWALMVGLVVGLMAIGLPVAFAFLIANLVGAYLFLGGSIGVSQFLSSSVSSVTSFALVPVPLFLLMGELFFHTGLARRVFDALDVLLGNLPGRLSFLAVGGGTLFAALSGSSMANTAMLGALLVPEMRRRGYRSSMSIGPILGTGGLAMIIPPSALAVLLGSLARIDIGALLIAGLLPGLILALLYAALIGLRLWFNPELAPHYAVAPSPWRSRLKRLFAEVLPMGFVVALVVGVILAGWATPTEAAAFGVVGVLVLAVVYRCLSVAALTAALQGALRVTAMTFLIIMMSSTFAQILAFSGASAGMIGWATAIDVSPLIMLLAMFGILLFLGMFMDQLSMMLLTVPVFIPLATQLGFDLVWFGVIMLLALEISFTTPPFGLLLFVMKGVVPEVSMAEIVVAGLPFIACAMLLVLLLVLFPDIALVLVR